MNIEFLLKMNEYAYDSVRNKYCLGMTEKDIEQIIVSSYRKMAGNDFSFCGDIIGGIRSADIEGPAGDYILKPGDTLILDLQPHIDGVFCDTTRTFFIGEPSDDAKKVYRLVKDTLLQLEKVLKPNICTDYIYDCMQRSLRSNGFNCPHHAGHIIGKNREIDPEFLPDISENIKIGTLAALEPGIYEKDKYGIRLENNYIVTDDGCKNLFNYTLDIEDFIIKV